MALCSLLTILGASSPICEARSGFRCDLSSDSGLRGCLHDLRSDGPEGDPGPRKSSRPFQSLTLFFFGLRIGCTVLPALQ
ncbi:hypothetical protein SISSUDRAFT_432323 [Sistotremastrum suecicum HHB10207 ss-3]|uniref:Hydrophobin n=1 Tax=Sistotremastrum suecicum HHB10207 ss-3 TaxID=1314776 RepID=A0A165YH14_9AGAM|nr:hypothetical protein SISSUDRAFT_432323 [Sistotremastrum suecicum HHB10207 ss-3]